MQLLTPASCLQGGQYLSNGDIDPAGAIALATTPCMSTGLWFAYPHRNTAVFFDDLLYWLTYKVEQPWDQAAFNEVTPCLQCS